MFSEVLYAKKDLKVSGGGRVSPERKKWVHQQSERIYANNVIERDKAKQDIFEQRIQRDKLVQENREVRFNKWQEKTKHSPFAVDLVAEEERIREENEIRMREEEIRKQRALDRKNKAKNDIILKALSEFSDLEALRREKRAIVEEEQRLRALLALEKTTVHGKADRLAAQRAERQRHAAMNSYRRQQYKDSLEEVLSEEAVALRMKHSLPSSDSMTEFRT